MIPSLRAGWRHETDATLFSFKVFDASIGRCRDFTSDPGFCGPQGVECPFRNGINSCEEGVCSISCNPDYLNRSTLSLSLFLPLSLSLSLSIVRVAGWLTGRSLDGNCIRADLASDFRNCGAVGLQCPSRQACVDSQCTATCPAGSVSPLITLRKLTLISIFARRGDVGRLVATLRATRTIVDRSETPGKHASRDISTALTSSTQSGKLRWNCVLPRLRLRSHLQRQLSNL